MKKYFKILNFVSLFDGISEKDYDEMLKCLNAKVFTYETGTIICLADEDILEVGIILFGDIQIIKEDYLGNRTIITALSEGDVFGETFACAGIKKSPVTVFAATRCEVLFIDYKKIVTTCSLVCIFHTMLIENMLKLLANKNLILNQKIELISNRTTREKLMSYFALQKKKANSNKFTVPFKRYELADYLCVDRSAMSRELCKMRDENLLKFNGNLFELLY